MIILLFVSYNNGATKQQSINQAIKQSIKPLVQSTVPHDKVKVSIGAIGSCNCRRVIYAAAQVFSAATDVSKHSEAGRAAAPVVNSEAQVLLTRKMQSTTLRIQHCVGFEYRYCL